LINNASDGDTIYLKNITYHETIIINKSINIIGKNRGETTIDFKQSKNYTPKTLILINADNCTIKNLKITNSQGLIQSTGIKINSSNNTISNNIISYFSNGINIMSNSNNNIQSNEILENNDGLVLEFSSYNNISHNNISLNFINGIYLTYKSENNTIFLNNISYNSQYGIRLKGVQNNTVYWNEIYNNERGIYLCCGAIKNIIYNNILRQNEVWNGYDILNNRWDKDNQGNYWDDYNGQDNNNDGIGDTPYEISNGKNFDYYPLINPPKIN
jgi:parallel beta-helix repeat protein